MRDPTLNFKNSKQRGEWVEMLFMARASREGLQVSKPYGESAAYDFIVESGALCSRIQVKFPHSQRICVQFTLQCKQDVRSRLIRFRCGPCHSSGGVVYYPAAHKSRHIPQARKAEFQVLRIRRSLALAEASRAELVGREQIRN